MTASREARPSSSSLYNVSIALRHLVKASSTDRRESCATIILRSSVRKLKWGTATRRLDAQETATSDKGANDSFVRADFMIVTRDEMKDL